MVNPEKLYFINDPLFNIAVIRLMQYFIVPFRNQMSLKLVTENMRAIVHHQFHVHIRDGNGPGGRRDGAGRAVPGLKIQAHGPYGPKQT